MQNLYLFYKICTYFTDTRVPVGTTELIHYIEVPRRYYRTYTYSYISDLILALRNMYLSYRSCTCFTDTGVPVGNTGLILIRISRRSFIVSFYAELILILQNMYLFYRYEITRRYYRAYSLYRGTP